MSAKLLQLRQIDFADMAAGLRRVAERIERGEVECDTVVILTGAVGSRIAVSSYGLHSSALEVQGWLAEAQIHVYSLARYVNSTPGGAA